MFINKMISSILNVKEIGKTIKKAVYIPFTQVEAVFEGKATSPTSEIIIKPCNERLMTWRSNSVEHNRSDPLPTLMSFPMMKKTLCTYRGQELHEANPSPIINMKENLVLYLIQNSQRKRHSWIYFIMIDNMHYVILRIWEQDSVPWCGENQNKILEVLGNTFNLHSNSTFCPRSVVSQSVSKGE